MKPLKILYLAPEVSPFAKTGGLADVCSALPKAYKGSNQEIRVMVPKYKFINERKYILREVIRLREIPVTLNGKSEIANVKSAFIPDSKVQVYFVDIPKYFARPGIYNDPKTQKPYEDNPERFAYFSAAIMETLKILSWQPDVIHCNGWQTAFVPVYLKTLYIDDPFFHGVKTVYTIHNLSEQGVFDPSKAKEIDFDESQAMEGGMFNKDGMLNLTKSAIYFSDFITTVSENYAHEILTDDEKGFGMAEFLKEKGDRFEGILNGVDYSVWSPDKDKLLLKNFTADDMEGKAENKRMLLTRIGLPYDENIPLVSVVTGISEQKGVDLILDAMDELMKLDLQFIILGDGDADMVGRIKEFQKKYPQKLSYSQKYDDKMAHLVFAGADIYLMPSRYEPCGLEQIYSLKYGTVPIVSSVGGLYDTVENIDNETGEGTGFILKDLSADEIVNSAKDALELFGNKESWANLRKEIMGKDFSWEISAKRYLDIFERLVNDDEE
jgi:starch synthase